MSDKEDPFNILDALKNCEIPLDEFKRLMAFLLIFQDDAPFLPHPAYLLQKYIRYIRNPVVKDEYLWGLHPLVRNRFNEYCEKYNLGVDKDE